MVHKPLSDNTAVTVSLQLLSIGKREVIIGPHNIFKWAELNSFFQFVMSNGILRATPMENIKMEHQISHLMPLKRARW